MDANQLDWIIKNKRKAEKIKPAMKISDLPFSKVLEDIKNRNPKKPK